MYYTIVWHESDGNDCTVYDTIVERNDKEGAELALDATLEKHLKGNDQSAESDGNLLGFYFDCDCEENPDADPETCDGHGGTCHRETMGPFPTYRDAEKACSNFHIRWADSALA